MKMTKKKVLLVAIVIIVVVSVWFLSSIIVQSVWDVMDNKVSVAESKQKKESKEEEKETVEYEEVPLSMDESWKGTYEDSIVYKARSVFNGLDSVSLENVGYSFTKDSDGNTGVILGVYTMYYDSKMSLMYITKSEPFTEEEKVFLDPSNGAFYQFLEEEGTYIFTTK